MGLRVIRAVVVAAMLLSCGDPTGPPRTMRPQSVVLFATPKMLADFANPDSGVAWFLKHYEPLIARASETIVIFSVGNSDNMLNYRGTGFWQDTVEWARLTDGIVVSNRVLDYRLIDGIVRAFRSHAAAAGITLKIYDQIDSGNEFTITNNFKFDRHPECMNNKWLSYDVGVPMNADDSVYASAPDGIAGGKLCGEFLVDQAAQYLQDLGFDGILYDNQLGTRGRWLPGNGPGYSAKESAAILAFLEYSQRVFADKEVMWFDSYNNTKVERETFSFPAGGYQYFDFLIASGFCVITNPQRYLDNLRSKLQLRDRTRVLATLDYVDPWYTYNSMTAYPTESAGLERIAIDYRYDIDGIVFFSNDDKGALVPRKLIESFATRFFGPAR